MSEVKVPIAALAAVSPMMAANDIRYYLNGVQVNVEGKNVTCVATDGHTLAVARHDFEEQENASFIVKREDVTKILRNISAEDGLHFTMGEGANLEISFGHHVITTTRIEGNYPDWQTTISASKEDGRQRAMLNPLFLERLAKSWKLCKKYGHFSRLGTIIDTNGPHVSLHGLLTDQELSVGYLIMPMRFDDNFSENLLSSFLRK